ncbi:MAG TPA: hydroxymethylbilane synthase [Actinomycetota bacterium]
MRLRIGTRRSRLALAQASEVAAMLERLGHETELVPMVTAGDRGEPADGSPAGVKGLFVAEITDAVLRGEVDLAVHSAKDLPVEDPEGVVVAAVPRRAAPGDLLISRDGRVEGGAVVGTSSLRRRAQLRRSRPGVTVRDLSGNVDTRLRKLADGECDALVLAAAGLARLGIAPEHAELLPTDEMVPAPGQGALAVQAPSGGPAAEATAALEDPASRAAFEAERGLVRRVGGGCRLPLGAYAEVDGDAVRLVAVVIRPDGSGLLRAEALADAPEAAAASAAEELLAGGAAGILRGAT